MIVGKAKQDSEFAQGISYEFEFKCPIEGFETDGEKDQKQAE